MLKFVLQYETVRKLSSALPSAPGQTLKNALTSSLTHILLTSPVLPLLKHLQSTLDILDIEGVQHLWNATQALEETKHGKAPEEKRDGKAGLALGEGQTQPSMSEWEACLEEYLKRFPLHYSLPSPLSHLEAERILEEGRQKAAALLEAPSKDELRYQILAYLLSATFKDCSILIRFDNPSSPSSSSNASRLPNLATPAPSPQPSSFDTHNEDNSAASSQLPSASIALIDLSIKPINRLEKWAALDRDIALGYVEFLKSGEKEREGSKRRNA